MKSVRALLTWSRGRAYYESGSWRGKWDAEGGGLLINQAIHTLDFFSYIVGEIRGVRADMCNHTLEGIIEVEDTPAAHLEFADGVKGVFFATNGYGKNFHAIICHKIRRSARVLRDYSVHGGPLLIPVLRKPWCKKQIAH